MLGITSSDSEFLYVFNTSMFPEASRRIPLLRIAYLNSNQTWVLPNSTISAARSPVKCRRGCSLRGLESTFETILKSCISDFKMRLKNTRTLKKKSDEKRKFAYIEKKLTIFC